MTKNNAPLSVAPPQEQRIPVIASIKKYLPYIPTIMALVLVVLALWAKNYFENNKGGPHIANLEQQRNTFWNVDRRYYIAEIPHGQEDDQRWQTFMQWQDRAVHFDKDAMVRVGNAYYLGVPVKQNTAAAAYWFKIAADEFAVPRAMYNYANIMADRGDRETYSKYLISAAILGLPEAQTEIARNVIATQGYEDKQDLFNFGLTYAKKAAESGSYAGILVYSNYLNLQKDKAAAIWLHKLHEKGDIELLDHGVNPLEVSTLRLNIIRNLFDNDPLAYQKYMKEQGIEVSVSIPRTAPFPSTHTKTGI